MHLFYTPDISGNIHILDPQESRHITRVLRLQDGDVIHLTDGKGALYESKISNDHEKRCEVTVMDVVNDYGKRDTNIHIAIAPTKNISRFEWFLEKAAELGIDEITPLVCEHSERTVIKPERLNKVLVAAMKQSLKAYLPVLNPSVKFKVFMKASPAEQKFIAYVDEGITDHLKDVAQKGKDAVVLIGPEGDFSENELKMAIENAYQPISLGKSRLRTETAGIAACHILNLVNNQ